MDPYTLNPKALMVALEKVEVLDCKNSMSRFL